jgi:hypothetical protein
VHRSIGFFEARLKVRLEVPMWDGMALTKDRRTHRFAIAPLAQVRAEIVARQLRVEELRRLVASGAYKVDPQRLGMRILFRSLGYSPEKRT